LRIIDATGTAHVDGTEGDVNRRFHVRRPSPALVLSVVALFFAIGGSAFAVGQRLGVAQPRCANGAVKGFAYVTGDPRVGIQNMPDTFSSNASLFSGRFDCAGAAVQVRRDRDSFVIKFNGIVGRTALVSGIGSNPQTMTVTALPDGSYRISPIHVGNPSFALGPEHQFAVVVF
jgi:hypothetical protein